MPGRSTLERPDEDFLSFSNTINKQCTEHATEWNIEAGRLAALNSLTENAAAAYEANSDKATRNLITSSNKKAAFGDLKKFLSSFIDYLEGNLSVPDEALAVMNLRSRTHHAYQPKPRPQEIPLVKVERQHDELIVYVTRSEYGHPTQSMKRESYAGFKLRWRFEEETTYHIEISTRLHYTLFFRREDESRRVILSAAWVNPRMEEGPWSDDVSEIVG
ncbi:MAG: hypothetical protein LBH72_07230 [Proteiniphilum sp.]|jgi:hypothetical protein|nr:hypothetical protein [Proteiniphilum sp.]